MGAEATKPATDEDLLISARGDSPHAFDEIVSRYEKRLLKVAYGILLDWHGAQDAAQSAFIGLFTRMKTLDISREGSIRAFLYRCVKNAAIDIRRKRRPSFPLRDDDAAPGSDPFKAVVDKEARDALLACMGELPEKHRLVLVLRFIGHFSDDEVETCLRELGWSDEALQRVAGRNKHKIREIAEITADAGVTTVGGVGNILKKAKGALEECFERRLPPAGTEGPP